MNLVKSICRGGMIDAAKKKCVSNAMELKYHNRSFFMRNLVQPRRVTAYSFSVQKKHQEDSRKLLQISQSIIPSLLQKQDFASTVEVIHQMAITLITESFKTNKSESKKLLLFIFSLIDQLAPHLGENEIKSLTKTLKLLAQHIDQINDTSLIISTDQMHLKFIQKQSGRLNLAYISALSKLAQNCITGDRIDRAFECLTEIEQLSHSIAEVMPLQVCLQNKINLGIVYLSQGKSEAAIGAYKQALKISESGKQQQHLQVFRVAITECLGDIYKDRMQFEQALPFYEEALVTANLCFSEVNINSLIMLLKAGKVCFSLKRYEEALEKCEKIEAQLKVDSELQEQFENYEQMLILMGELNAKLDRPAKAIQYFQAYIANAEKSIILQQRQYCEIINRLIDLHLHQGNSLQALKHLKSLTKYYKIQGNESAKEACEERAQKLQKSMQLDKNVI